MERCKHMLTSKFGFLTAHWFNGNPEATALRKHWRLRLVVKQLTSIHAISQ